MNDPKKRTRSATLPIEFAELGIAFNPRTKSYHNLPAPETK